MDIEGITMTSFLSLALEDAATQTNGGRADHWAFMSGFGRVTYNFNEKYLFEATGRYEGTIKLKVVAFFYAVK